MNRLFPVITSLISVLSCTDKTQVNYNSFGPLLQKTFIWKRGSDSILIMPHSAGFRKEIEIKGRPRQAKMMIFVDSRYVLWINGKYVERGPCRFDPKGPEYDLIDIRNNIQKGKNTLAVLVHGNVAGFATPDKMVP
jgi:hypothetical protein